MKRAKKVCVIAGGGIFGCLPIHFLSMLPTDQQNLEGVDVLGGCSVGSVLACALATGQQFAYVDDMFQKRVKDCFTKRCMAKINPLACPTYRSDTIYNVLTDMMGDMTIAQIKNVYPKLKLVSPALDVTNDKYLVFSNLTHEYDDVMLRDVAAMSSAAPSYFDCVEFNGAAVVDGGLLDVDSCITTVTQVKKYLKTPFIDMDVLVLGCGFDKDSEPLTVKGYRNLGLLGIATEVLRAYATRGNQLANQSFCEGLGFRSYTVFNPITTFGDLDDVDQVPKLVKEADEHREDFLETWNKWRNA